jgi:hypothetical protein
MRRLSLLVCTLLGCRPTPAATPDDGRDVAPAPTTPVADSKPETPRAATWFGGEVELPGGPLAFFIALQPTETGWSGAVDIPAQGARGLPVQNVAYDGKTLAFEIAVVAAKWSATLDGEGESTACTLTQSGSTFPCALASLDEAAYAAITKPKRPQTPTAPLPYPTRDVMVKSGDVTLAGTLSLPTGNGPFPAAILITGSGAQDRDETLFDHKPFAVLADHLARNGVATLRLDDRGVGGSTGDLSQSTTEILAGDVLAAHAFLREQPELAKDQIGVIGHSEGGIVGPAAAAKNASIAFVVMLAGTGVPGDEVVVKQVETMATASGVPAAEVAKAVEQQKQIFAALRLPDEAAAKAKVAEIIRSSGPVDDATVAAQSAMLFTPWFKAFMKHDPREALSKVKVPVLVLGGTLDLQVDVGQNIPEIKKALKKAKNRNVTVHELAGLNHLFQRAKTGVVAEYGMLEETMSPQVLTIVSDWIRGLRAK